MASQLYMEWVKEDNGQYTPTNIIDPFGNNYIKVAFKDNYTVTSNISQRLIDLVNDTSIDGEALRFTNFTFTLGTGSTNANTETGTDDWSLAQQQEMFGYGYEIEEIHTGGQFLKVFRNSNLNGIPYAFHAPADMNNFEYVDDKAFRFTNWDETLKQIKELENV